MNTGILRSVCRATVMAILLGSCLYADILRTREIAFLSNFLKEIGFALHEVETQYLVYLCEIAYFITFAIFLGRRDWRRAGFAPHAREDLRATRKYSNGNRWRAGLPVSVWIPHFYSLLRMPMLWLGMLFLLATLAYWRDYAHSASTNGPLIFVGGMVLGQVVVAWAVRSQEQEQRAASDNHHSNTPYPSDRVAVMTVITLVLLLLGGSFFHPEIPHAAFQYRGVKRWTGPWDNPNTFGLLMGTGFVLAMGLAFCARKENRKHLPMGLYVLASLVMGVMLVKSYSRGAWVATILGLAYLGFQVFWGSNLLKRSLPISTTEVAAVAERRPGAALFGFMWRHRLALGLLLFSLGVLAFCGARHVEAPLLRRAFSAGNPNDFSWRNRVAAWEGALQMMSDRPWVGFGWNQPETYYNNYYRSPKLQEGMAIQMNDFFMLGMILGLPGLFCFVRYIGLNLASNSNSDRDHLLHDSDSSPNGVSGESVLPAVCRAATVVMLVGFWFDGGLFKLATAAPFWVLLGLCKRTGAKPDEPNANYLDLPDAMVAGESKSNARPETAQIVTRSNKRMHPFFRPGIIRPAVAFFALAGFVSAMLWARSRDPFERIAFSVPTVGGRPVRGLAVLPKPAAKCPVVVFFHGSGSSLLESGKHLRQIAELGLAAVGIEYDQSSQPEFDRQCSALCEYIGQQPWALSNATAWIGLSLGAQRSLSFVLRHPETQPQLLVRLAGGWISELDGPDAGRSSNPVGLLRCPVLLVHGENDAIFPVADAKRLLNLLEATGKTGKLIILPNHEHGFGDDREAVMRAAAEFCRAQLPVTDYLAALAGCSLTPQERQRANAAMQRAGSFRRELWQTIISIREPERSRLLPMISGLDDYDLVRLSPRRLKAIGLAVRPAREN